MRRVWRMVVWSIAATGVWAAPQPVTARDSLSRLALQPRITLQECRLEHPLRLASLAARCGILRVAEDRSHLRIPTIELNLAVVPALNRRSAAAPLFLLAGGPGQSAIALYAGFAGAFARINRNHDIVMLDQRGTGKSAPLDCDYPDDWQKSADTLAALRQATRL